MTPSDKDFEEDEELLAQMRADFLDESKELLEELSERIVTLEKEPHNTELINEIFRGAHSIKGSASFVGLEKTRELAHALEDLFGAIRDRSVEVDAALVDLASQAIKVLSNLRQEAQERGFEESEIGELLERLGKLSVSGRAVEEARAKPAEERRKVVVAETLRVSSERLDELVNSVSELVTIKNRIAGMSAVSSDEQLGDIVSRLGTVCGEIQRITTELRLVSLEKLFRRFPGLVRDLAREMGKEVDLEISGGETEIDKSISEHLYDPLVHIIRNSIDHGIEKPEARESLGKPRRGRVSIRAEWLGSAAIITVEDDGAGLDAAAVRSKALSMGLVTPGEAEGLSATELAELIFTPGFTTSKQVSAVSGRGVGMDVVRAKLAEVRGSVRLSSEPGCGTTVRLTVPVSIGVSHALLVRDRRDNFAFPLEDVREVTTTRPGITCQFGGNPCLIHRGDTVALFSLSELIGRPGADLETLERPTVIVEPAQGGRAAIVVDAILGKQELVIKELGPYLGAVPGAGGAAISADGSVAVILDLLSLLRLRPGFAASLAEKREAAPSKPPPTAESRHLVFHAAGEHYGLPIESVETIVDSRGIETLVGSPRWLLGTRQFQETYVWVVDLAGYLDGVETSGGVVIVPREKTVSLGISVDGVVGVDQVPTTVIAETARAKKTWLADIVYQRGRAVRIIDPGVLSGRVRRDINTFLAGRGETGRALKEAG